jgi:hypothetical protein
MKLSFILLVIVLLLGAHLGFPAFSQVDASKSEPQIPVDIDVEDLAKNPLSPIKFDKVLGKYFLEFYTKQGDKTVKLSVSLDYSPFSGKKLEAPTSSAKSYEADKELGQQIYAKIKGINTVDGIKKVLGEPDRSYGTSSNIVAQLDYENLSKTTDVSIEIRSDGKVLVLTSGKEIK